jgi:hypothetical protein
VFLQHQPRVPRLVVALTAGKQGNWQGGSQHRSSVTPGECRWAEVLRVWRNTSLVKTSSMHSCWRCQRPNAKMQQHCHAAHMRTQPLEARLPLVLQHSSHDSGHHMHDMIQQRTWWACCG